MSRKPACAESVQSWIRDNPEIVFNGVDMVCTLCDVHLSCLHRGILNKHLASKKHQTILCGEDKQRQFNIDLVKFMVGCNIPWVQLDNPTFREFIENCNRGQYAEVQVPSSSTLRKVYLPKVADNILCQIRSKLEDKFIWLCVDETTNPCGDKIGNVLVGAMEDQHATRGHLLVSRVLNQTTADSVFTLVSDSLKLLWGDNYENSKHKLLLFITDAAAYMKATGRMVQGTFTNCLYVTCLAHALHRVAETIRACYPQVDTLIDSVKKVFRKAPERQRLFCQLLPTTELPPQPVVTRWGTWIEAARYYLINLEEIKLVLQQLDPKQAVAIAKAQEVIMDPTIKSSLQEIHNSFSRIPSAIRKLEQNSRTENWSLIDQVNVVYDLRQYIAQLAGYSAENVKKKMEAVLEANPGFTTISYIIKLLQKEEVDFASPRIQESSLRKYCYFRYAPVTSVDIERSFSMYKWIFSDRRRRLTAYHMEQILRIYFFYTTGEPRDPTYE